MSSFFTDRLMKL